MKKDWMIKESELDDDQIQVLMATLDKSCIVAGCAGSGKSVLALIKAQRIQKEYGDSYKIIVLTKALCRYMNAGRQELGLHNDFYYYWEWKNRWGCPSADYIIVDEIQDFTEEEILEFLVATRKNFFFFGDTAQSIYEEYKPTVPVEGIRNLLTNGRSVKNFELYRNYRLPIPVAKVALKIGDDVGPYIESVYKSKETEMPRLIRYNNQQKQLQAISTIIRNGNMTDVAILVPYNEEVKQVYDSLKAMGGNYEMKYEDKANRRNGKDNLDFDNTNPKIMTYHSAKGLQFETVFLPFVERGISNRKALYVAMTRTYRSLYIMYSGNLPSIFSHVDESLYKTTVVEDIEEY